MGLPRSTNLHGEFHAFLRSLGLRPGRIVPDGKVYKCQTDSHPRKKNGRYFLFPDGLAGWGQDWSVHHEPVYWHADGEGVELPEFDPVEHKRRLETQRRGQEQASTEAREFYASCDPLLGGHPYLESHGLGVECTGLRVDDEGWLVVPAYRMLRKDGDPATLRLVTVQRISPEGKKLYWPGAPVTGASFMAERRGATLTVIAEGVATGLAIYKSIPTSRALVAFSAGNMYQHGVLERVTAGVTVVAADNDHETEQRTGTNPGVVAAGRAAALLKCGIAVPPGPPECEGTDWSDFLQERTAHHMDRLKKFEKPWTARSRAQSELRHLVEQHATELRGTL